MVNDSHGRSLQSGRLNEPPAASLIESAHQYEASYGPQMEVGMSLSDIAYTIMLIEKQLIPSTEGEELLRGLLRLHERLPGALEYDPAMGDPYTQRETILLEMIGRPAEWLGFGRARRESTTIGYLFAVSDKLLAFADALTRCDRALLELAEKHTRTLMPDYTYLQRAQPTTLGHYLLTFSYAFHRDFGRIRQLMSRVDESPAGCGSVNGSRLPLDRIRLMELLGFRQPTVHPRDAMWRPDIALETVHTVQIATTNLDRLVEDLHIWASQEFSFVELADRHSRISKIMPNKKNPYALSFIRGICRQILGQAVSVAAANLTPSGQTENRLVAYVQVPKVLDDAEKVTVLLADVLCGLKINPERMAESVDALLCTTDLAEQIALETGLTPRETKQWVGRAVREVVQTGRALDQPLMEEVSEQLFGKSVQLSADLFSRCLDPRALVEARKGLGGASPECVESMIAECFDVLSQYQHWLTEESERRETFIRTLLEHARQLLEAMEQGEFYQ